jgi:hypothetical protein
MTTHQKAECRECGDTKDVRAMYRYELYYHPWDKEPHIAYLCKKATWTKGDRRYGWLESCDELLTDSGWADFRFFECDGCHRWVCEQNPDNGWMTQVRNLADGEVRLCLKCYEENLYANGVDREDLENNTLPGMFLNHSELIQNDFIEEMSDVYIRGKEDAKRVCQRGLELMDSGHIVLIAYERMAIGGLEGYVSLYSKKQEKDND